MGRYTGQFHNSPGFGYMECRAKYHCPFEGNHQSLAQVQDKLLSEALNEGQSKTFYRGSSSRRKIDIVPNRDGSYRIGAKHYSVDGQLLELGEKESHRRRMARYRAKRKLGNSVDLSSPIPTFVDEVFVQMQDSDSTVEELQAEIDAKSPEPRWMARRVDGLVAAVRANVVTARGLQYESPDPELFDGERSLVTKQWLTLAQRGRDAEIVTALISVRDEKPRVSVLAYVLRIRKLIPRGASRWFRSGEEEHQQSLENQNDTNKEDG